MTPEMKAKAEKAIEDDKENANEFAKALALLVNKHYPRAGVDQQASAFAATGMAVAMGGMLGLMTNFIGDPSPEMRERIMKALQKKIEYGWDQGSTILNPDNKGFKDLMAKVAENIKDSMAK